MFRAVIKVIKYSTSGWDNYKDTYEEYVEHENLRECKKLAKKLIDELKEKEYKGDFNITLTSYDAEVLRYEEFTVLEGK